MGKKKNRGRITSTPNKGDKITAIEPKNYDDVPPVFSLEKIVRGKYCFSKLCNEDKRQFAESIYKRRDTLWKDINNGSRHKSGTEKIPKRQIRGSIPKFITDDFKDFLVFRFSGMKPMVGYRDKNIFYVLWFDHDFSLYNHG